MKKKIILLITVFVFSGILFSREIIIKANTKKEKNQNIIENHLLLQYVKNKSNIEDVKYIPLDKKIIGNKRITDKSNVVDIGFGEYYIKAKDEKKELQEPSYSSWYEAKHVFFIKAIVFNFMKKTYFLMIKLQQEK